VTLTIHTEENEQRELKLTIEVPEERVEKEMRQKARKLAHDIHIPGFRRGKVPYHVLLRRVGREALRADAIDDMVQGVFEEALEQVEPDVYGRANFEDMELEPLVLRFTVPLTPQVKLGDYRDLRKDIEPVNITDTAVDDAMEQIQIRHQQVESVDRPAAAFDIITINGKGELIRVDDVEEEAEDEAKDDGSEEFQDVIFNEESVDFLLDPKKLYLGAPFVNEVVGLSAGDEKSFTIEFPADYQDEELAGKEAEFEITVLDVKKRELPPLDDELAKLEGDYESLEELREKLEARLFEQAQSQAKNELIEGVIDDILETAEITYPPAAVEMEIDEMVANFKEQVGRSGWEWDDFLKMPGNSEEDIRNNFQESAQERLKRQQILRQFVLNEKLTVNQEDVESNIEKRLESYGDNDDFKESMRKYFSSGYGFDMISSEVIMDKVHERMTAILSGDAPDLEALAAIEALAETADEEE
jgi:trigger factor